MTTRAHHLAWHKASGLILASVAAATLSAPLLADAPILRPGKYERTQETSIAGRPPTPAKKDVVCFNQEDVRNLFKIKDDDQNCKKSDLKVMGTTATFTASCELGDGSTAVADVTMTFTSPESFRGVMNIKRTSGTSAGGVTITTTGTGRRIGDCTK